MTSDQLSRRGFAVALAVGGVGSALGADDPAAPKPAPAATPAVGPVVPEVPPTEPPPTEDLLLMALVQMYPSDKLTPERLEGIFQGLRRGRQQSRILRTVPLLNSDEPATVLRAFRGE